MSAGPSAMTSLYFCNCIISSPGDPSGQLDSLNTGLGSFSMLVRHRVVIASKRLDVVPSGRQYRIANAKQGCQVLEARRSGGEPGRGVKRSEASVSERGRAQMPAVRRRQVRLAVAGPGSEAAAMCSAHGRCSAGCKAAGGASAASRKAGF